MVNIELGILADSLSIQLDKQNLKYGNVEIEAFEHDREALNWCRVRELIPPSQLNKGYDKLMKSIVTHLNIQNPV